MALTDSLISCWEMEEVSGTRIDAVIASANDLTDNNTVTQAAGKVGNCAQFTLANTEWLSRVSNASLVTGDIDFTVAAWAYLDSAAGQAGIVSKTDQATWEYELYATVGTPFLFKMYVEGPSGGGANLAWSATSVLSTWYYLIAWHDSVNNLVGISVDDGTPATTAWTDGARSTSHPFNIGGENGASTFDGRIDQVCFWKRMLTPTERTQMYNGGAGLTYAQMVGSPPTIIPAFMNQYRQRRAR